MMNRRISAGQLHDVLNRLPNPRSVENDYWKVVVRREVQIRPNDGLTDCMDAVQIFEFEKSEDGRQWLLASVPDF